MRNELVRPLVALAATCLLTIGSSCGDREAEREAAAQREWLSAIERDADLSDPLGRSVLEQVRTEAGGWIKHQPLFRGTLAERGRQGFLAVLPYGHCYKFFGAGGAGVGDLDLALIDPNGVEVQRDVTAGPTANLGVGASLCPSDAGAYRIEARMRRGQGPFAIGLFRSEGGS